ncbi:hypothetical protein CP533_6032 [Ophiocordyceps camponoti-saundersi (nom. inval.)]|nr:hypothetical protein CP533_6032 [Ophiocordyceps camponoti-saundersi (nom. inval.)]
MHFSLLLQCLPVVAAGLSAPDCRREVPAPLHKSDDRNNTIPGKYIVKFKRDADMSICRDLYNSLLSEMDHVYEGLFRGFARSLNEEELDEILYHVWVDYVAEDGLATASGFVEQSTYDWGLIRLSHNTTDPFRPDVSEEWKLYHAHEADSYDPSNGPRKGTYIYDDSAGEGTCVYVIDSGIDDTHPDFQGRAKQIKSFVPGQEKDGHGHGTHVAGIIGSETFGVAKKTRLYGVKILEDKNTTFVASSAIAAFDFVAKDRHNRDCPRGVLVNFSAGCDNRIDKALDDAVAALVDQGIFVSVAAGNMGVDAAETSPGSDPSVCVVGAVFSNRRIHDRGGSWSSNHGSRVDVFAPGKSVSLAPGGGTWLMDGTSVSAAFVTGLAAYLGSLEGLKGTPALCGRIRELSNKGTIKGLPEGTANRVVFNGSKPPPKTPSRHDSVLEDAVFVCENDNFGQPCAWVKAPPQQCVPLPDEFLNKVSSLEPNWFAGTCRFYTEAGCRGGSFQVANSAYSDQGVNLTSQDSGGLEIFNNGLMSFQCDGEFIGPSEDPYSLDRWQWSPRTQKTICSRLDRLDVDFRVSSGEDDGTLDTLRLEFVGMGGGANITIRAPPPGFQGWQPVDLKDVFGSETIDIGRIRQVRVNATQRTWKGADPWGLSGIGLRGQCEESKVLVNNHRFTSINQRVSREHAVTRYWWNKYTAWEGYTGPEDWAPNTPCSHFHPLEVYLEIANEDSAEADNEIYSGSLYLTLGKNRTLIAQRPSLGKTYNVTILKPGSSTPRPMPVALKDVDYVGFESVGGNGRVKLARTYLVGRCAGTDKEFRVEREIGEWIGDEGTWGFQLSAADWGEAR